MKVTPPLHIRVITASIDSLPLRCFICLAIRVPYNSFNEIPTP
jgi:hypothetical protein